MLPSNVEKSRARTGPIYVGDPDLHDFVAVSGPCGPAAATAVHILPIAQQSAEHPTAAAARCVVDSAQSTRLQQREPQLQVRQPVPAAGKSPSLPAAAGRPGTKHVPVAAAGATAKSPSGSPVQPTIEAAFDRARAKACLVQRFVDVAPLPPGTRNTTLTTSDPATGLGPYPNRGPTAGNSNRPLPPTSFSSGKLVLKHQLTATTPLLHLHEPPAKKPTCVPADSIVRPIGSSLARGGSSSDGGSAATRPLGLADPRYGIPAARPSAAPVVAEVAGGGAVYGSSNRDAAAAAVNGTSSAAGGSSSSSMGLGDAGGGVGRNGSAGHGLGSTGNVFDLLSVKKEPVALGSSLGGADNLPLDVADVVIVSSDEDSKPGADEDDDADLMVPVELGTSTTEPTSEVSSAKTAIREDEYLINGEVHSFPKLYTIDLICERHREREKAKLERKTAEERLKIGGFDELLKMEEEKDRMMADNDDDNILSEEQRALARQMSVPASVLKDRHPGHQFCAARLRHCLFTEINCHSSFEPESSAEGNKATNSSSGSTTPLGLYPRAVEHMMTLGQLHLLLQVAPNKSAGLDYAFCLMSCHSKSAVVEGIKNSLLEMFKSPLRGTGAARDVAGTWYPTSHMILGIFMNFGVDLITSFSLDETLATSFLACKDLETTRLPEGAPSCSQPTDGDSGDVSSSSQWPTVGNVKAVLSVVSSVARARQVYNDGELETMVLAAVLLALDVRFTEWDIDFEMCYFVGAMLRALSQNTWREQGSNIVRKLAVLLAPCHHHTRLRAVEFFTFNEADVVPFVRCRLAYAVLQQLLFCATEFDDIDDLKVKMLINVEQSIILPTRGQEVDLYLTATELQLLFHSVNLYALDKDEQADLHKINTSLKEKEHKIRCSYRSPDSLEIKHQIILMTSMWTEALPRFENQLILFYDRADTEIAQLPLSIEKVNTYDEPEGGSDGSFHSAMDVDDADL